MLPQFADAFHAVAPDQRGYGRSSKPVGVEHYKAQLLAKDMLALADEVAPGKPIHLVAHDWGASIGYMMAFFAPSRVAKLVVINGVHPVPFQRALIDDPEQRSASQYIRFLRRPEAADRLGVAGQRRARIRERPSEGECPGRSAPDPTGLDPVQRDDRLLEAESRGEADREQRHGLERIGLCFHAP